MRKPTRSPKKDINLPNQSFKVKFVGVQAKISFRCDTFLIDRIKNALASQHLAGNYQIPNLSFFFSFRSPCLSTWNAFKLSTQIW